MAQASKQRFAFGGNTVGGCPCPAVAAGMNPDSGGAVTSMAERYDAVVRDFSDAPSGTISKKMAIKCWNRALRCLRRDRDNCDDPEQREYLNDTIQAGERVLATITW